MERPTYEVTLAAMKNQAGDMYWAAYYEEAYTAQYVWLEDAVMRFIELGNARSDMHSCHDGSCNVTHPRYEAPRPFPPYRS